MVLTAEMSWKGAVAHVLVVSSMSWHLIHRSKLRVRRCGVMSL